MEPYSRLIWSYQERGLIDKAIEYCLKSMSNVDSYPFHYDTLAKIFLNQGKITEARNLLWDAFLKCNKYYFQGMETVALFPKEDQDWFLDQIKNKIENYPEQEYWMKYLE